MSLFHSKVWWQTKVTSEEEFDSTHLCIGRIGSEKENCTRIGLGSFSGKMRIFEPKFGEYKPHHLIYEQSFEQPILSMEIMKKNNQEFICILLLKGFMIFTFYEAEEGLKSKIKARVDIKRPCYNMEICPASEEVLLCVQTIDGMLAFYNMNKLECSMQLKSFIIPSPMIFVKDKNFIVIQNSSFQLEAYKYENILAKGSQVEAVEGVKPDWDCLIGESAMSFEISYSQNNEFILAACEVHLFVVIASNGKIKYIKKLQCVPSKIIVNNLAHDSDLRFIISAFSHHLLFYKNFELIWAAKTDNIAHGIQLGNFGDKKGLITTINEEGWLSILYLGAEPPKARFQYNDTREETYENLVVKSKQLREKINDRKEKESNFTIKSKKGTGTSEQLLNISVSLSSSKSTEMNFKDNVFVSEAGAVVETVIRMSIGFAGTKASNICINLKAPSGFNLDETTFNISSIVGGGTPTVIQTKASVSSQIPITVPLLEITACYDYDHKGSSFTGCYSETMNVGLQSYSLITSLVKEATYKLTIEANKEWPNASEIFEDYINETQPNPEYCNNPNALSFILNHGSRGTVLIAKNSNKMRVQGDTFDAIYSLLQQVVKTMEIKDPNFMLTCGSDLPLKDFSDALTNRMEILKNLKKSESKLEEKTNEMMHIQKRLLTRFKEKNPTPLNNLDSLFELVFRELVQVSKEVEKMQTFLIANSQKVTSSLKLILLLIKIKFPISKDGFKLLEMYIDTEVETIAQEIGWIDITYANITFFIQTVLLGKQPNMNARYDTLDDLESFNKRFTKLIDNISAGVLHDFKMESLEKKEEEE